MSEKAKRPLTAKQAAFVQEYLIDLNATQAAIRAGYSKKRAKQTGAENVTKRDIKAEIDKALEERSKRTKIDQDQVIENITRIGDKAENADRYGEALKAQEMLAKHVKLFSDDINVNFKHPPEVHVHFVRSKNAGRKPS